MAWGYRLAFLLLIYFGLQQQTHGGAFIALKTAIETGIIVRDNVNYVKSFFEPNKPPADTIKPEDVSMLNSLYEIDSNIIALKEQLFQKVSLTVASKLDSKFEGLTDKIDKVNIQYKLFMEIVENLLKYNIRTVDRYTKAAISPSLSELIVTVEQMHTSLYKPDYEGKTILSILSTETEHDHMCGRNQSAQQMINELFKTVVNADAKSLATRIFAHAINEATDNTTYNFEIRQELKHFNERVSTTYVKVADAMKQASRDIWRCDPMHNSGGKLVTHHQKDKTYCTVDEIFQSVLIFERDINKGCRPSCSDYKYGHNNCNSPFCQRQKKPCNYSLYDLPNSSVLRNCKDMSNSLDVCHAPPKSERQYDWSRTETDLIYGRDRNTCSDKKEHLVWEYTKYGDAQNLREAFATCSYCLCTCDDLSSQRARYFSLRAVKSNKDDNKVVTGVRFKKYGHVFYIEIQQGKLLENGSIGTTDWLRTDNRLSDSFLARESLKDDSPEFYQVTWRTKAVYLDDIIDKNNTNKVLTGLRFIKVGKKDMKLQAELTEFDYITGKLGKSQWHANRVPRRTVIDLKNTDDPVRHVNDAVYSHPGSYVEFQSTDLVKDMGQLTVPFIEMQEVVSNPPVPITGVSLFLKATQGSGGFLAFKLTQYDFTPHL